VVPNDLEADGQGLVFITGPNSGGKTTFLRSLGIAQLMMQAGMFVPAERYCASLCGGLFTHFPRGEDVRMERGKLDEELGRMSEIVGRIRPDSMVLVNEAFASTNEREGAEIARQIVRALTQQGVRVFFVTHLFELARSFSGEGPGRALLLRAERLPDGTRTYRIRVGEPLATSHGEDVYRQVFGSSPELAAPRVAPS
jgi:DNA mismatch repair ATPase MutS